MRTKWLHVFGDNSRVAFSARFSAWIPFLIALLHVSLAASYAWITPYRTGGVLFTVRAEVPDIGAPDESQHVNYVRYVADGRGIPVFDPKDPDGYENHQPPLYYAMAAGWATATRVGDFESFSDGFKLRLLTALIGGAGVLGVYFLAMWGLRRRDVALVASGIAALLPMNVALSGAVSNDPLLFTLCTWALAVAAKGIRDGWTTTRALLAGAFCGLAILDKTNGIVLLATLPFAFLIRSASGKTAIHWKELALCLGLGVLFALPWWIRNTIYLGDPLAMGAFMEGFGDPNRTDRAENFIRMLGPFGYWTGINEIGLGVGWWVLRSLLGVFGYMDIFLPKPLYWVFLGIVATLLVARLGARTQDLLSESKSVRRMGGVLFLLVLASFVQFNTQYFQAQARYLLPAIGPMCMTLAVGACTLGKLWKGIPYILLGSLLAVNLWILNWLPGQFERRMMAAPRISMELEERQSL